MKHETTRGAEETADDPNRIERHTEAISMPVNMGQKSKRFKIRDKFTIVFHNYCGFQGN
jgi:hypothetical protein